MTAQKHNHTLGTEQNNTLTTPVPSKVSRKKAFLYTTVSITVLLLSIITGNTIYYDNLEPNVPDVCEDNDTHEFIKLTEDRKSAFKEFLSIQTVTYGNDRPRDLEEFEKYKKFVETRYSEILSDERVEFYWLEYTLLIHLKPSTNSVKSDHVTKKIENSEKLPILFLAHIDVVPATAEDWEFPPFNPTEDAGYVYARGTIDNKNSAFAHFESLEYFLKNKTRTINRDIFVGFPEDEEGDSLDAAIVTSGAHRIKDKIRELGWNELDFVWDEGGCVVREAMTGVSVPVAMVGVCEKNYMDVAVEISSAGGHSSMSKLDESTVLKMSKVLNHLADNYDFISPSYFDQGPESPFLDNLIPHVPSYLKPILSNRWLFGGIVEKIFLSKGTTQALVRSIMGFTQFHAGIKNNVQPASAKVNINFRTHPYDQPRQVLERIQQLVSKKFDFEVSVYNMTSLDLDYGKNGCNLDQTTLGFRTLKANLQKVYQNDIVVTPYLTIGNTDARKFEDMSKNVYRFSFFDYHISDLNRFHGKNERILWTDVERALNFHFHVYDDSNEACDV